MDKNDQLLGSLLYLFHTTGMQGLGKLMNPVSQKIEKNIIQAKESIDMLEMLKEKTKVQYPLQKMQLHMQNKIIKMSLSSIPQVVLQ